MPENVTYRLDYINDRGSNDYTQLFADYGWEYKGHCFGWNYFCKPDSQIADESEREIFSDNGSRVEMIEKIFRTRMLPLVVIFLCCVIPNFVRAFDNNFVALGWTIFWSIMLLIYIYLLVHCTYKLRRIKKEYGE